MSDVQTPFQLLVDIDQRCRRLAAGLPAQQEAVQSWSGIGFRMGGRFFVAPMGEVGEVLHEPRYTQLPGVKTWVKGVANVRGRLLPIMDLCGFLGTELSPLRKQRRVLVVEHLDVFAGLIVDEVFGMQHFPVDLQRTAAATRSGTATLHSWRLPSRAAVAGVQPACAGATPGLPRRRRINSFTGWAGLPARVVTWKS